MLRVMVVDDEMIIRNGIAKYIECNIDGFTVPAVFKDGSEAIEYLRENDVDIVLSDIRMLRVSGIELAEFIYENKPYTKMIMLSGYQEFEYAQSAIQYGVSAYLSKPTNLQELKDALNKVAGQLRKPGKSQDDFIQHTKGMFELLVQGARDQGMALLEEIFEQEKQLDARGLSKYLCDFFEILYDKVCLYMKVDLKAQDADYAHIAKAQSKNEAKDEARTVLEEMFKRSRNEEDDSEDYLIKKAKDYIDENFAQEISLQQVADFVYLNPVYFSRVLKHGRGRISVIIFYISAWSGRRRCFW